MFHTILDEEPMSGADIEVLNALSTPGRSVYFNYVGKTDLLQVKKGFIASQPCPLGPDQCSVSLLQSRIESKSLKDSLLFR